MEINLKIRIDENSEDKINKILSELLNGLQCYIDTVNVDKKREKELLKKTINKRVIFDNSDAPYISSIIEIEEPRSVRLAPTRQYLRSGDIRR